ncbi:hypothetical protein [Marinobacter sp. F3R08]|uniref:hypothetical protein n=1 Tax=Marinobacter sp. F3R08 TaxID=2841559 RepID=UPI001C092DE4|nr:hypothetical protein [Marinobacter sp. F3R08]MBU2952218.1 hypothetical protein [Marinobacter sp. F3R08]
MDGSQRNIPKEVRDLLVESRFGISFPCTSGCQMRFVENGKNLGGFYSYRQWGGIRPAVQAAKSRNLQLRAQFGRTKAGRRRIREFAKANSNTGVLGVSKNAYLDKRRGVTYIRYMAAWNDRGTPKTRGFHLCEGSSGDHHFHALRTAIAFRKEWERDGDGFDPARFQLWKTKRLYEPGEPDLPSDFWD